MRKTLYLKFLLAYLIFGFFGFIVVATFGSSMTLEHMKREKADTLYKEATLIANTYASDLYNNEASLETVKIQLDSLAVYLDSTIWIINPSGRMIMDTNTPVDLDHPRIVEGFNATETVGSYYTIGNFFDSFDKEMLSVYAPITSDFKVRGYVVIHTAMASLRSTSESLLSISYIILVILFLLSLIILIFFTEMVYLPLRKITEATEQYAAGNLHYEFQVDSEDEIGYLAASLSYMASEIARGEDNQKKFIANVSHELRSPLALIGGYAEMVRDITWKQDEQRTEDLNLIIRETNRMSRMVSDILDYSQLQAGYCQLKKESLNLCELLESEITWYRPLAQEHHITLELECMQEELLTEADASKMNQVIRNLLNNAVNHTADGGCIRITADSSRVSIANPGPPIPEEDRALIWERYQRSQHQSGRRLGTGIGLSIVRTILEAHHMAYGVDCRDGWNIFWFSCQSSRQ